MAPAVELQRVFKYDLKMTSEQFIEVPMYAKPLKIAFQERDLKMWCQVTPSRHKLHYRIFIFGTGDKIPHIAMDHLDTVIDDLGLVWHVYLGIE